MRITAEAPLPRLREFWSYSLGTWTDLPAVRIWSGSPADFRLRLFPAEEEDPQVSEQSKQAIAALSRSRIAVYPVNVRGVVVNAEGMLVGAAASPVASGGSAPRVDAANGGPLIGGSSSAETAAGGDALATTRAEVDAHAVERLTTDYQVQNEVGAQRVAEDFTAQTTCTRQWLMQSHTLQATTPLPIHRRIQKMMGRSRN